MKTRVMELNASDERGIAVVRDKVKTFAQGSVGGAGPPFKIIILDEADSLTQDAQAALRRTMETFSRVTRFCIICNYVSRIIDPVASRCSKYRFSPLSDAAMLGRLQHISAAEGVQCQGGALPAVLRISGGDMRKAITFLQSAAQLYGGAVTAEAIVEISGVVSDKAMGGLLTACLSSSGESGGFDIIRRAVQSLLAQGYSVAGVLDKLCDAVVASSALSGGGKAAALERLAAADKKLADGADEELQVVDVCCTIFRAARGLAINADKERLL